MASSFDFEKVRREYGMHIRPSAIGQQKLRGLNPAHVNAREAKAPLRESRCCGLPHKARYVAWYNEYICQKCFKTNGKP